VTSDFLSNVPSVLGVGLPRFTDDLAEHGALQCNWGVPAGGDMALVELLLELERRHGPEIDAANREVIRRMLAADPVLVDVVRAGDVMPRLGDFVMLHAGPPVRWERMCGPMRGAIAGAAVFEGWATNLEQGDEMAASGAITFAPNHDFGAVGPMTGITTANMAVMVVENRTFGNRSYCTLNEGLGKVMRFGGNDDEVIARLHWLANDLAPVLSRALVDIGGLALTSLIARGLTMGDEMHQRNVACSSLTVRELAPAIAACAPTPEAARAALAFAGANDQFFLNIAMAAGKAITDPCQGVPASSLVTAMSRNGTDFGVRMSATDATWYTAPVEMPRGLYFPGFSEADANPDMGDSTIVETIGLGGFAMAAAPAVAGFVGAGNASQAKEFTRAMFDITTANHPQWRIPALNCGVPIGIDVRAVVRYGRTPTINTGIAHREPGVGQVGAGVVNAPGECFVRAVRGLAQTLGIDDV
jgi:hypothetical protein